MCRGLDHARQTGLPREGRQCLALSLLAVVWWAFGVVFRVWATHLIYLVIGGYLIAACYLPGFLLSFVIPRPWPRSFIIMLVMATIIKATDPPHKHAANIGLAVFAGSVPAAMILLTGDSTLNLVAMNFAGAEASWLRWLIYIHKEDIRERLLELGALTCAEKTVVFRVAVAVAFWDTDFLHHVHPGWIALSAAVMLFLLVLALLVGIGESQGKYQEPEVMKLGIPLTLVIFLTTGCVEIPWWYAIGLIK